MDNAPRTSPQQQLTRVPTGVPGLDVIMHGGFLRGGINIIAGQPGTGKTVLSNQIAFAHVASGGRAVYVSLLSETHGHLFAHLSSMSFFHEEPIGNALYYVSGYGVMRKDGLKGLAGLLQRLIRDHAATLLILDGALNADAMASSELEFKEFIHQLQIYAETTGCTAIMLMSLAEGESAASRVAGRTTVDGLIELSRRRVAMRVVREVEVQKLRGSAFMEGGHALQITGQGVEVYPRTEALLKFSAGASERATAGRERMPIGVARLDEMLRGGLLAGSSTVLLGPSGSGKTLLGLSFLAEGARRGEPCLYFGLNEPLPLIVDAADQLGLGLSGFLESGELEMLWQPPLEAMLDKLAAQLLEAVRRRQVKRLFIDGLESLSRLNVYPERTGSFFTALLNELRALGVATISSVELRELLSPTVTLPVEGISAVAENIIFMRSVELESQLHNLISIVKVRRTGYDAAIREFTIGDRGIEIGGVFRGAAATLTGLARPLPGEGTG